MALHGRCHQCFHISGFGYVGREKRGFTARIADRLHDFFAGLGIDVVDQHARAFRSEPPRNALADAAAGTGHDD